MRHVKLDLVETPFGVQQVSDYIACPYCLTENKLEVIDQETISDGDVRTIYRCKVCGHLCESII